MEIHNRISRVEKTVKRADIFPFSVELSFTLLDWILMDNIIKERVEEKKLDIISKNRLQLCFNVLPKGYSFFHHMDQFLLQDS